MAVFFGMAEAGETRKQQFPYQPPGRFRLAGVQSKPHERMKIDGLPFAMPVANHCRVAVFRAGQHLCRWIGL